MKRHAVLLTVLFALSVTIFSVSYTFREFYQLSRTQYINNTFVKYNVISQIMREYIQKETSMAILEANLAVYDLDLLYDEAEAKKILSKSKVLKREGFQAVDESLFYDKMHVYKQKMVQDMRASMLYYDRQIYFFIEAPKHSMLVLDKSLKPYTPWNLLYTYVMIISVIIISFVLILQRIRPLRRLRSKVAQFGTGDMNVSFKMDGEDEIAMVSNELENTRAKIQSLIESRTLFLRNIMHELKTPIAKGRIASHMIESEKQRVRFNNIFERLESLINEFALIEEVTSGFEHLEKQEFRLIDLIDGAIDIAMIDREDIEVEVPSTYMVLADYRLFSTAIKNMIDNAIKYSPDKKVRVKVVNGEVWFENIGKPLEKPLSYYVEPFTKEHPAKDSFGLGLYLVDAILKAHNMVLAYEFEGDTNRFIYVAERRKVPRK